MDTSLDDAFVKDTPESDEELDAFNCDTFGDGNDQWDWDSQQEQNNLPTNSSVMNTSKNSLPPLPDVSAIRSLADLEKDFMRESIESTSDSTPKTLDRAMISIDPSKIVHLSDLEETMRRDSSPTKILHSSNVSGSRPLPDMSTIKSVSEIEADLLASSHTSSEKVWPQGGKSLDEIESELFSLNLNSSNVNSSASRSPTKSANTSNNNSLSVFPNLADSSIWAPPEYSSLFPPLGANVTPSPSKGQNVVPARATPKTPSAEVNLMTNQQRNEPPHSIPHAMMYMPHGIRLVPPSLGQPGPLVPGPNGMMMHVQMPPGVPMRHNVMPPNSYVDQRQPFVHLPRPGMPFIPLLPNGQRLPMPVPPINLHPGQAIRQLFPPQLHHSTPHRPVQIVNSPQRQINDENRKGDEYAGLMTQDERKWLTRIQRLQLEGSMSDPYVDDYYSMAYQAKKIEQSKSRENKTKNKNPVMIVEVGNKSTPVSSKTGGDSSHSSISTPNDSTPQRNTAAYTPRQYEGSLGKLQAVNLKCPRKLLDLPSLEEVTNEPGSSGHLIDETAPLAKKELRKLRLLLLEIERLYLILLKIDYTDKRMAALPDDGRKELLEARKTLCQQLFEGITTKVASASPEQQVSLNKSTGNQGRSQQLKMLLDTMTNTKLAQKNDESIDLTSQSRPKLHSKIASTRKGATLIIRSLSIFQDAHHKAVLIADLIDSSNFHLVVLQKDKALYGLDYAEIVIDSLKSLENGVSADVLLLLSQGLNDASNVARYPCGEEIIQQILHLSSLFLTKYSQQVTPDFSQRWDTFLLELIDEVDDIPDLRKLVHVQQEQLKVANLSFNPSAPNGSRIGSSLKKS